jgi:hypothetical protein
MKPEPYEGVYDDLVSGFQLGLYRLSGILRRG